MPKHLDWPDYEGMYAIDWAGAPGDPKIIARWDGVRFWFSLINEITDPDDPPSNIIEYGIGPSNTKPKDIYWELIEIPEGY